MIPRILITGISGFLGYSLERQCIQRNITYFGHINNEAISDNYIECDFSHVFNLNIMEHFIIKNNINCLINCAGIYCSNNLVDISDDKIQSIINVNLVTPIILSKYLYTHLEKTKQQGKIININSLAGKYPNYLESIYCASKFGLTGFSSCLSINQKKSKIDIIDLHIGAMNGGITKKKENKMNVDKVASFIIESALSKKDYIVSSAELRNI